MSYKSSLPGNDRGRDGEIRIFEDSSHRVGCEKVHPVRVDPQFLVPSKAEVYRNGMTKQAFSELCQ